MKGRGEKVAERNLGCVPLRWPGSGSDHSGHGASKGPPSGGYVCPLVWILKHMVSCIEEEATSLLVFYNCCVSAFVCHCRSFNPSLCRLSSFLLSYATVSRPYWLLELALTGPHHRIGQIQSGKGFIGSFDLHDLSDLRSLILIPMEWTHCGRHNTSWRKLYTPLNHMHEEGSDLWGMHIPTSHEPPTLKTLLVVYSSYIAFKCIQ